ncbi:MAG: high light inducible protein [Scytonematopsis contorta HA4267-MV1]|jgi:hypothetical protein|nr:high light inducible protein [Scytonematopsis contorta HA4267-MV1]
MSDTTKAAQMMVEKRNAWTWGFNIGSENWNGRLAMIGFLSATLIELFSGEGFLHFWGVL